jgi:hypothetical protein
LDEANPWSVLTTCAEATPSPRATLAGTGTLSWVGLKLDGEKGPALIGPLAVATKKLTTEPAVNPLPLIAKVAPTKMFPGIELITGAAAREGREECASDVTPS